ncbi:hypothetical protein EJ06DRAFT_581132 [Trichodelitschia bisporula]|uniref:Inhibitor I9 domain-containing protein n=1 Tax=Trichodelitschia bisporula TaxID=703511 RepID=A0A6G1I1G9_9PEZI|nr:hypothetical protein EJ06DRAFT_581132 [Trichodelitschia bisporula]
MPGNTVMITLKEGASPGELENAKKTAIDQGGKIVHESKLIKSIQVEFPEDKVHTLSTNDQYTVEADQTVSTQ